MLKPIAKGDEYEILYAVDDMHLAIFPCGAPRPHLVAACDLTPAEVEIAICFIENLLKKVIQ